MQNWELCRKTQEDKIRWTIRGVQNPSRGGANAPPSLFIKVLSRAVSEEYSLNDRQGGARGFMVKYVTVGRNKEMTVIFRDGTEIQA